MLLRLVEDNTYHRGNNYDLREYGGGDLYGGHGGGVFNTTTAAILGATNHHLLSQRRPS